MPNSAPDPIADAPPPPTDSVGRRLLAAVPFGVVLFGTWLVLSPKRDLFHLGLGAATAAAVALLTARLVAQPPSLSAPHTGHTSLRQMPWLRFVGYLPWLAWQVVVAGLEVTYTVLHPRLPISPRIVRITAPLPHTLAKLTLANSITLTPGTVTLDVEGDTFLVHALTEDGSRDLQGGAMSDRVSSLFTAGDDSPGT
jgi:multicomponent Na+:H+ antiporter subunit E